MYFLSPLHGTNNKLTSASINHLVGFTAAQLHAALITPFFVEFTQRVLVEGYRLGPSMKYILASTSMSNLPHHTNIIYIQYDVDTSSLTSTIHVFTHPKWRPWGNRLSAACPKCSSPHSWSDVVKQGSTYTYNCRRYGCPGSCSFPKPEGFELSNIEVNGGRWMQKEYMV